MSPWRDRGEGDIDDAALRHSRLHCRDPDSLSRADSRVMARLLVHGRLSTTPCARCPKCEREARARDWFPHHVCSL